MVAVTGALASPGAYTVATVAAPHQGGGPAVGPPHVGHATTFTRGVDNLPLQAMLKSTHTPWSAAVDRSSNAAALELSSDTAVMAIGGFSGTDPVPTLSRFQQYIADRQLTYYIATTDRHNGGPQSNRAHSDIANWVAANYSPIKVGDDTVYDLTKPVKR